MMSAYKAEDEFLRSVVDSFDAFEAPRMHGAVAVWYRGAPCDRIPITERFYLGVTVKESPDGKKPPMEVVSILHRVKAGASEEGAPRVYELPYGTLLNVALGVAKEKIGDESLRPESGSSENPDSEYNNLCWLEGVIEEYAQEWKCIDDSDILDPFFEWSYAPLVIEESDEFRYSYVVASLSDIVFHTIKRARDVLPKCALIKKCECKNCGKVYFARSKKPEYCYFPNPDARVRGESCQKAMKARAQYEKRYGEKRERAEQGYESNSTLLNRLKARYEERSKKYGCNSYSEFSREWADVQDEHRHDLFRYGTLHDWLAGCNDDKDKFK